MSDKILCADSQKSLKSILKNNNNKNGVVLNLNHEDTNDIEINEFKPLNTNKQEEINKNLLPKRVTLTWKSVNVKTPIRKYFRNVGSKTILNNVNGIAEPGQMVALMGARYY